MNTPLRRVAVACLVLFFLLLANATYVQVVEAHSLSQNPHNSRLIINSYSQPRGDILVDGQAVAESVPTKGGLKYQRTYPGGSLFAPVTGFYSLVYGASDIERAENSILSGTDPRLTLDRLYTLITGKQSQGGSVVLTLNRAAQTAAAQALGDRQGAVVALDPRSGAILALVTNPSYNPSSISANDTAADIRAWKALQRDKLQPMLDRATQATYPPGSTFKIVTTSAALASGRYTPQTQVPDPAELTLPDTTHVLHNFESESCSGSPTQSLADALRVSCDTAFASIGLKLGWRAVRSEALRYGFTSTVPGLPLDQNAAQFPPVAAGNPAFAAYDAIGQGDVAATPMQMAMVAETIADGGTEMTPYLVARTQAPNLSTLTSASPHVLARPVSGRIAGEINQMMVSVVTDGTGTAAAIPGVQVAGKTGTAETGTGNLDDWFIAFAPASHPTIALAVVVAAPVARSVLEAYLNSSAAAR